MLFVEYSEFKSHPMKSSSQTGSQCATYTPQIRYVKIVVCFGSACMCDFLCTLTLFSNTDFLDYVYITSAVLCCVELNYLGSES